MGTRGYYRHPSIAGDDIVFTCEDDLWLVSTDGGAAFRLTANPGTEAHPRFSPNGELIAYVSRDEGRWDTYVVSRDGGTPRRLTYFGRMSQVVGWSRDGSAVIVASDYRQPFAGWTHLWNVPVDGSPASQLSIGSARAISYEPGGRGVVIARNSFDPARWKRYRGGLAGSIWIDREGSGEFEELIRLDGNLANPMWIGRRIYFLSDHEGVGNIYSVTPTGRRLVRHTHHEDFYARFPSTDGKRVVYHCGADLWLLDPSADGPVRLDVTIGSSRPQLARKLGSPGRYLEEVQLNATGDSLAAVARGTAYTMALWEGAVGRHGAGSRHRRRLARWLPDSGLVSLTDAEGEECLVVESPGSEARLIKGDFGRARTLDVAPRPLETKDPADRVALTNHRHELMVVDLRTGRSRTVYRSPHHWIMGTDWSPDGRWLAFSAAESRDTLTLFLYDSRSRRVHRIGRSDFADYAPSFDSDGKYLYFLSARIYDPVYDGHFHDYGFPRGHAPFLLTLKADQPSPFAPGLKAPRPPGAPPPGQEPPKGQGEQKETRTPVEIDLEGIEDRVVAFPVPEARYTRIAGAKGRVFFSSVPIQGSLGSDFTDPGPSGRLEAWDLASEKVESIAEGVSGFGVSGDGKIVAIRHGKKLRVVPVAWKDDKNGKDTPGRDTGWVDLDRIRIEAQPADEWRQMFSEAWRLQRDHYWYEGMGGVDWVEVHQRYASLIERLGSRAEFSDLMWEMQGELGTSHAYELGGDYRPEPTWSQGSLGAVIEFDRGFWRIARIPNGDSWDPKAASPLAAPGVGVAEGDRLLEVDGVAVDASVSPESLLVDRGDREVTLTVATGRRRPRQVVVRPMLDDTALWYRDWVEQNRRLVSEMTDGAAGYIHIPDMGALGFSEFHRYWKTEVRKQGLVIDVRFNRGGNVSQLLLEKLLRKQIGFRVARWREPYPLPDMSPSGPMVCLTNELAGSDGDIFSHTFKIHGLGPLIGTRTWGGVVGIWPQQSLVDGTITTQPEFHTWFSDVGYRVENYGTDPDIEVVIKPADYHRGHDPQLERGVQELSLLMEQAGDLTPELGEPPSTKPPKLPQPE